MMKQAKAQFVKAPAVLAPALQALQAGRPLDAQALLEQLIARSPREAAAYALLADVLLNRRLHDEAIAVAERGLKVDSRHKELSSVYVRALVGAERYDLAIAWLERVVADAPRFAQGHAYLGSLYAKRGDAAAAAGAFRTAVSLDARDALSWIALGECELVAEHAVEALAALDQGLALAPTDMRGLALQALALAANGATERERWLADPERLVHRHSLTSYGLSEERIAALLRALSDCASNEPSLREDPPQYTTVKAWHSTTNLADYAHPAITELKALLQHVFRERLATLSQEDPQHPFVRAAPPAYHLDLWAIRMRESGQLLPHVHVDGWLSGVLYVDVPAIVNDPSADGAGWIEFGGPRRDIRLARPPLKRRVKPEPGLLITFPSYIWHATVPLPAANDEQRLCLAFDFSPRAA